MIEFDLREQLINLARSMFLRGYSSCGAGNISLLLPDRTVLMTPARSNFGQLDPTKLSKMTLEGNHISGDIPSNESSMHLTAYKHRPYTGAVLHLHSPYLTALSCLQDLDPENCIPPLTPSYVVNIGKLPLIPYLKPGNTALNEAIAELAPNHSALLLANHGIMAFGPNLHEAICVIEELENMAQIYFQLRNLNYATLNAKQIGELNSSFVHGK